MCPMCWSLSGSVNQLRLCAVLLCESVMSNDPVYRMDVACASE